MAKSWEEFRDWQIDLLTRRTGTGLEEWNARIANVGFSDEASLRDWLRARDVTGYSQMLLVHETFGYPEFLTKSDEQLVAEQYADRPGLRPILDAVLATAVTVGDVTVGARKTYVPLSTPRRMFALVRPTTRTRVDLGLRLLDREPGGTLLPARSIGSDAVNLRVALTEPADVDDEVHELLRAAYAASS